ncbi:MAG: glycosyltransferase, partial [Candidatus Woesearchaeota archaeon]
MNDITIGIPLHKSANAIQLKEAIDSVIDQKLTPYEIHLIQDGEITPEIAIILDNYIGRKGIKHIHLKCNVGLAKALNESIKQCSTNYYARMDADDISHPERLQKQMNYLAQNPNIDICGTWAKDIDAKGDVLSTRKVPANHKDIVKYIWTCPLIHPTVVFKVSSIKRVGLYNEELTRRQDYELWFRCVKANLRFANLPEPLLLYRFTEEWFEKNNRKVIWDQVKMGWHGCNLVKAPPKAYIGITFPLIKLLIPKKVGIKLSDVIKK